MNKARNWAKAGSPIVLAENHGKRLVDQSYTNPLSGKDIIYTIFDASIISVIIFGLTTEEDVVAIKQFRPGAGEVIIELPGGNRNKNESLIEAARRELTEETGYTASEIIPMPNKLWIDPVACTPYIYSFLALGCHENVDPRHDENETIETLTIPLSYWMDMIYDGEISDMKTIAITLLATSRLSQRRR